ncbi:MAG TPA: RNA-binding protein [Planctomycetota bacterium]|nr:RNA-binding protein [Planctomycetota bacterium]
MELFVGNLPWTVDDAGLQALFAQHGNVQRAKVITDRETGKSRGFGFVTMASPADGQKAIQALNGTDSGGRALTVRAAEDRRSDGGGGGGRGGGGGGGGYGGGGGRGGGGGGGGGRY